MKNIFDTLDNNYILFEKINPIEIIESFAEEAIIIIYYPL
jgi:hypothetical protein